MRCLETGEAVEVWWCAQAGGSWAWAPCVISAGPQPSAGTLEVQVLVRGG
jgi:hypothetical protein